MNNNSRLEMTHKEFTNDDGTKGMNALYEPMGNPTEVAMLKFLQQSEKPVNQLLSDRQTIGELECIIPFSPEKRRQTTVIRPYKGANFVRVVVKGAPEQVLKEC